MLFISIITIYIQSNSYNINWIFSSGKAHSACNLAYSIPAKKYRLPIFFHNLKGANRFTHSILLNFYSIHLNFNKKNLNCIINIIMTIIDVIINFFLFLLSQAMMVTFYYQIHWNDTVVSISYQQPQRNWSAYKLDLCYSKTAIRWYRKVLIRSLKVSPMTVSMSWEHF